MQDKNEHTKQTLALGRARVATALMLVLAVEMMPQPALAAPPMVQLGGKPISVKLPDGARVDGALIRDPGGEIDVVYGGARFHVPDPATLTAMFGSQNVIQLGAGQLARIGKIPMNGTLLRDRQSGEIDVVVGGKRYHIPNMDAFNQAGFAGKVVHELWAGGLAQIPEAPWPAPTHGPARDANEADQQLPPTRTFQATGEISGPVCPDGGHVEVTVDLVPSPGAMTVHVHAKGTNHCVTDDLGPTVTVKLLDQGGNRVADALVLEVPRIPARGFNHSTVREADSEKVFTSSLDVSNFEIGIVNRFKPTWFIQMLQSPEFWEIVGAIVSAAAAA